MSTTYTTNAGLGQPAFDDRNWHLVINANLAALDVTTPIGGLRVRANEIPSTSRVIRIAPGSFITHDGSIFDYAGGFQTVPASSLLYYWLLEDGTVGSGGSWPTGTAFVRLARVQSDATTITLIDDLRVPFGAFGSSSTIAGSFLPLAGGTMTGAIVLPGDPTSDPQAASKHYVDASIAAAIATVPGGAPAGAHYYVSSADAGLPNAIVLTAGTGLVWSSPGVLAVDTSSGGATNPTYNSLNFPPIATPSAPTDLQFWYDSARRTIVMSPGGLPVKLGGIFWANTADAVISNTSLWTSLAATGVGVTTVPGYGLAVGKVLRIVAWGTVSTNGSVNLSFQVSVAGAGLPAITHAVNGTSLPWWLDVTLISRGSGVDCSLSGFGHLRIGDTLEYGAYEPATAVDNTFGVPVALAASFGVADVDNVLTCKGFTMELAG